MSFMAALQLNPVTATHDAAACAAAQWGVGCFTVQWLSLPVGSEQAGSQQQVHHHAWLILDSMQHMMLHPQLGAQTANDPELAA